MVDLTFVIGDATFIAEQLEEGVGILRPTDVEPMVVYRGMDLLTAAEEFAKGMSNTWTQVLMAWEDVR